MEKTLVDLQDFVKTIAEKYGERDVYRYIVDGNVVNKSFKTFERDINSVASCHKISEFNKKILHFFTLFCICSYNIIDIIKK